MCVCKRKHQSERWDTSTSASYYNSTFSRSLLLLLSCVLLLGRHSMYCRAIGFVFFLCLFFLFCFLSCVYFSFLSIFMSWRWRMVWYSIKLSIIILFRFSSMNSFEIVLCFAWAALPMFHWKIACYRRRARGRSFFTIIIIPHIECTVYPCNRVTLRTAPFRHLYSWHYIKKFSANPQILLLDIYL